MLGLIPDDRDTKYRKRHTDVRDTDTINKHLGDYLEQHMGADEKPVTSNDIDIDVPNYKEYAAQNMLRRHEKIWAGQIGERKVMEMKINLVPDAKPFKSPTFEASLKTRELERAEIDKQFKAGFIEPAMSKWEKPVLFAPEDDGKRGLSID